MKVLRNIYMVVLCLLLLGGSLFAQNKSNRGKEFWLGYGFNYLFYSDPYPLPANINHQDLALYISTTAAATVTVSINNTAWTQTLNIPANTVDATVIIPKSGINDARIQLEGLWDKGIHIVSDVDVAVYAHQYGNQASGATMLMPVETYGYSYYSVNYHQNTSGSLLPIAPTTLQNGPNWYSWFYVIAAEDNTKVEIIPSDTTSSGWLPGQTYTVTLNKGELYNVFGKLAAGNTQPWAASKDMTGSKIKSVIGVDGKCHPAGVFSGSGGIRLCRGDGGEYMGQQIFPARAWGTRYLTYHLMNNISNNFTAPILNFYRVCVADPTTIVKRNGVVLSGLVKNFYYEFSSTTGDYIEADKPVLVSQYTPSQNQCALPINTVFGDPEMVYLSPVEQGQNSVLYYTNSKFSINFIYTNIIVKTAAVNSLVLDGTPVDPQFVIPHPANPLYSVAFAKPSFSTLNGQHTITCDSTFTATVYGCGTAESYGYNVGCFVNNLNTYSLIKNTFNTNNKPDTFTCPKTPMRLFANIAYRLTSIQWKLSQATGITPNADSIISNPVPVDSPFINGRKYYTYTLQQNFTFANTGTYTIPVTYSAPEIDQCNNTETANIVVLVKPGPVANFSVLAANCLRDTVFLTGTSATAGFSIASYLWNFDDATTQGTVNAKKKFTTPGNQTVRYRIYADNGCAGDTSKSITINPDPTAIIGAASPACTSDSVLISDTSIIASGSIASWQYLFGDGNTLTRNNGGTFKYAYTNPGTYTIKLITTSDKGCKSDTGYRIVTVFAKPRAKFGYDGNICVNDSIRFTDTSSIAVGSILSYQWNFGDGNTLIRNTNTAFYHPYTTAGSFIVTLVTVSDMGCKSDTFRRTVFVSTKPVATHTAQFTPCVDSQVVLKSSYTYGAVPPVSYHWFFGDGTSRTITTSDTAIHRYPLPNANIITKHFVSAGAGCVSDTFTLIPISIYPNPVAGFTFSSDSFCFDKPVTFNSTINGGSISEWRWSWGDGFQLSTTPPPIGHTYLAPGTYNTTLTVRSSNNNGGCISAPFSAPVTVYPRARVNAGPDLYIQPGQSIIINASVTGSGNFNLSWSNAGTLSSGTVANPVATPPVTTTYVLTAAEAISKCAASDAVTIFTVSKLFIPNSFTPNGDGKHDTWNIPGMALYPDGRVTIYNRYGEKVYDAAGYLNRPWDGTYKGQPIANGSYIYFIQLNNDKKEVLKGFLLVIR